MNQYRLQTMDSACIDNPRRFGLKTKRKTLDLQPVANVHYQVQPNISNKGGCSRSAMPVGYPHRTHDQATVLFRPTDEQK